jgi:hypothetical protein
MKLQLEEPQIKELEAIITEMPYKYAQPLLTYLAKFVTQETEEVEPEK